MDAIDCQTSSTPSLIDTHCHLDFSAFDQDRSQVLQACHDNNIMGIVVPTVSQATWQNTIALCINAKNSDTPVNLHLALGLHPVFIEQHQPQHLIELDELVGHHKPLAIGEIGLDYYQKRDNGQRLNIEKQTAFFTKQLIIAKQHGLPVIIHNRKAHDQCVSLLTEIGVVGGIIHNFNGSIQHAHKYVEMGFKLGFGGMLTFERSRVIRNLAKQVPLQAIVLETDAPDLTVAAYQGQRNSPAYLPHVLRSLAEIKGVPINEVAAVTSNNAREVLRMEAI